MEEYIKTFIQGTEHYFSVTAKDPIHIGAPYLIHYNENLVYDYTGIIGVSGVYTGNVYFSATQALVRYLLLSLEETDFSSEMMCDMVGEIANTVSGNARRDLGSKFMISTPVVLKGKPGEILLSRDTHSFVIPLTWGNNVAVLVVSLKKNEMIL